MFPGRLQPSKAWRHAELRARLETHGADLEDGWYVLNEVVHFPGPRFGDLSRPPVIKVWRGKKFDLGEENQKNLLSKFTLLKLSLCKKQCLFHAWKNKPQVQ